MATIIGRPRDLLALTDAAERTAREVVIVSGVTGDGIAAALDALSAPGIPPRLSPHPDDASLVCLERIPVADDRAPSRFRVELIWGPRPIGEPTQAAPGTVIARRLRPSGNPERTVFDKDGNVMQAAYVGLSADAFTLTQVAFEIDKPGRGYVFEVDQVLADGAVSSTLEVYRGAVNSLAWNGRPARTWLCGEPHAEPIRGTENYLVTWAFVYRPETWDHRERVRLAGHVPSDYSAGGEGQFRAIREVDFSPLPFVAP